MSTKVSAKCNAKNPSLCRFHGNPLPKSIANVGKVLKGGGDKKAQLKYVQDACEFYAVAEMQKHAEILGVATNPDGYQEYFNEYKNYLLDRGISHIDLRSSELSIYPDNIDMIAEPFIKNLMEEYPNHSFSFKNIAQDGRNSNMKGDVLITVTDAAGVEENISVSLKNYKGGIGNIQSNASTYQGFVMGFLFAGNGVGHWDTIDGKFNNRDVALRNEMLSKNGFKSFVSVMDSLDTINNRIRSKYIDGDKYKFYTPETHAAFSADAKSAGHEAKPIITKALKTLPNDVVRKRVLKMTGFDGAEEMLMVGGGKMFSTVGNKKYKSLVGKLKTSVVEFDEYKQGIVFRFVDPKTKEELLFANVPLTINKNGAWNTDGAKFSGKRFHKKENSELVWGERRAKKSREMATSTNCYINLNKIGLLQSVR